MNHERDDPGDVGRDLMRRLEERDEQSRRAHAAAAELIGLPAAERPGFVTTHPDCLGAPFIELMIAMARERRGPAPEESVAFAHLAATAAEAAHSAGADDVDDARALAFAELGNAHRICGDLRRAGIAFGLARERVRYAADPLVRAEVDSLEASYQSYRSNFDEALRLLNRAERIQSRCGSPHEVGRIHIQRGNIAQIVGDPQEAIELFRSGLTLLEGTGEPRLVLTAIHNLAFCLIDLGEPDEALSLLHLYRADYQRIGGPADCARLNWLEGKAARRAGLLGFARVALEEVRDRFAALGLPYETIGVLLDLGEVYGEQGSWIELEQTAAATLTLCRGCGIGVEGMAAAALLHKAAERREMTAEKLATLTATVRRHLSQRSG